jgi:hypothetical protein
MAMVHRWRQNYLPGPLMSRYRETAIGNKRTYMTFKHNADLEVLNRVSDDKTQSKSYLPRMPPDIAA